MVRKRHKRKEKDFDSSNLEEKEEPKIPTRQETQMKELVNEYHGALDRRSFLKIKQSLENIKENIEPLNYWLPYKDLTSMLMTRFNVKEVREFSEDEVNYLKKLGDKLWDKDSDVGLGTVKKFYSSLEDLKAERQANNVSILEEKLMDERLLEQILFPKDYERKINEFRYRDGGNKGSKGFWSSWDKLSEMAVKSNGALDNILNSGINSEKAEKYVETFMGQVLYTNVFQCNMGDDEIKNHFTNAFRLYFALKEKEGMKKEDMPKRIEEKIQEYIDKNGDVGSWKGVKEFALMHVSREFAKEKFMGAKWKNYNSDRQCVKWFTDYAEKGNFEKAKYIEDIASSCGNFEFRNILGKKANSIVHSFTKKFVRNNRIDKKLGNRLNYINKLLGREIGNFELQLSQPFTYFAIMAAANKGHEFAKEIIEDLSDNEMGMFGDGMMSHLIQHKAEMESTPFLDYPAGENEYDIVKRLQKSGCFEEKNFVNKALEKFNKAIRKGNYFSIVNECNTTLEEIEALNEKARTEIKTKKEEIPEHDNYDVVVYVTEPYMYVYPKDKEPAVFIGMPKDLGFLMHAVGMPSIISSGGFKDEPEFYSRNLFKFEDEDRKENLDKRIMSDFMTHSLREKEYIVHDDRIRNKDYRQEFSLIKLV